jgi:hypothetical protein
MSQTSAVVTAAQVAPSDISLPTIGGTAEEGKTLTAAAGSWSGSPTSIGYQWQTCNSSGTGCVNAGGETGQTYRLSSADVGETIRVVVTAQNAAGSASATSTPTPLVAELPVVVESAPANTVLPTISGDAVEGQTLSATTGTWSGTPTAYAYQWQDCTLLGVLCLNVGGATHSTYTLGAGDVGEAVRVVVTASNGAGSGTAASLSSGTVAPSTSGGQPKGCIGTLAACGYPDPTSTNVGPGVPCSSLTPAGEMTITKSGTTIQDENITGQVTIAASNVTLSHDCVTNNGGGEGGSAVVIVEAGGVGAQIDYSDLSGENNSSGSVEEAIRTNSSTAHTTADHDYLYNCGECFHGAGTLTNSYVIANAEINPGQSNEDHYEDIYDGGGGGPLVVNHNTMLNPHQQTAVVFASVDFGDQTTLTITDNLMAGGDYVLYGGGSGSGGSVIGPVTVTGNRFSRVYYELGGSLGIATYFDDSVTAWLGNMWDETLDPVPAP